MLLPGAPSRTKPENDQRGKKRKATEDQLEEAHKILQDEELELEGKRYT